MYFSFELEGTYVNVLIWWFEDNWLLRLGAIVIQSEIRRNFPQIEEIRQTQQNIWGTICFQFITA